MKFWLLTTEYPPFFGGGIATYAGLTAQLFSDYGHEVTVIVYDEQAQGRKELVIEGIRVIRFSSLWDSHLMLGYPAQLSYAYAKIVEDLIVREGPPDLIESQEYLGIAAHLLQRKRTLDPLFVNIPVIITAHNPKFLLDPIDRAPTYQFPDYWTGELERFSLRAADGVISPSAFLRTALTHSLPDLSVEVIPNPYRVPPQPAKTSRQERLLYVGRLQLFKGILDLLEALVPLWNDGFTWPLDIVGHDSPYYPKGTSFKSYIDTRYQPYLRKGLIRLHPAISSEELGAFYAQAGCVILPSRFDNLPYVLLEAMSYECVVVATQSGGQKEVIIDGESGFLCQAEHLGRTIKRATELSLDQQSTMGHQARTRVASWTDPESIYEKKMDYIRSLLHGDQPRSFPVIRPTPSSELIPVSKQGHLSIVIPFYNLGSYLLETLDSLMQLPSSLNKEIIVVDDGSTDGVSIAALRKAARTYPDTTIYRTPNQGLARARNFGASKATGTFLAFLDADDKVDPRYYPRAIKILQHYDNVSFVGCWAQYFGVDYHIWPTWNPEPPYALFHNPLNTSALVYLRDHFLAYGQNDPEMEYGMEDYESLIRMLSHGCHGVAIPEPYFFYRVRPHSMSREFNQANQQYLYRLIVQKNRTLYMQYADELFFLFNANGPQYSVDNPTVPPPLMGAWR
ncbi:MAG: hypothetical protein C7B47_01870 [Sulfobacillus thermosulfidooxidans]|uniref:Uncharacterized protein n=1 Tax=Sulfobacillus thermosulfidooxidans TaxID=28034 RepID=A0A2T2X4S6_SULTH|nr:MAG: hypothetical protein C7B47_01870 [Sulfobacillus thermosulfidooxidans]